MKTDDERILSCLPFVARLANRYASGQNRLDRDDLIQEGVLALLQAAKVYDLARGVKFLTYAFPRVHRQMQRALRRSYLIPVPEHNHGRKLRISPPTVYQERSWLLQCQRRDARRAA